MSDDLKGRDDSTYDLEGLQGTWEQTALEADGIANPPDEYTGLGVVTTFSGNHFAVCKTNGVLLLKGTFMLDASVMPKAIDYVDSMGPDKGKRLLAIYTLEGDRFQFIAADEGDPRPSTFRTGLGQTMRTFRRAKTVKSCGLSGTESKAGKSV